MTPSAEFMRLSALQKRKAPSGPVKPGDLWRIRTEGNNHEYVMLVLGHKKNGRRLSAGHTYVYLYHWAQPSLRVRPCDLRDFDGNATAAEHTLQHSIERGEFVVHLGNIFDMLPLSELLA